MTNDNASFIQKLGTVRDNGYAPMTSRSDKTDVTYCVNESSYFNLETILKEPKTLKSIQSP